MSTSFEPGSPTPEDFIPLCAPEIQGNAWKYVKECLDTNWVSSVGPYVDRFERELAAYVGIKHAVCTVNGTAALHIALLVAGVQPNDEVLVSDLTFVAPVNAVRYVGAYPVFMDAEPDYWQMDPQKVTSFLNEECQWRDGALYNKVSGRRVKAIIPVHILGHPVDMDPVLEVAQKYNLVVIEDATESLGAKYKGRMTGTLGEIACFSFNGNKIITTGGGGMIVTNNSAWAQKAKYLTTQAKDDPLEYIHKEIGYNYRLTNVQAAIGVAQLEQLNDYIAKKHSIACRYSEAFKNIMGIKTMATAPWAESTSWLYTILIDEEKGNISSRQLIRAFESKKIQTRPFWCPMHMLPIYKDMQGYRIEVTPKLYKQAVSLPCSVGLKDSELNQVVSLLISVIKR